MTSPTKYPIIVCRHQVTEQDSTLSGTAIARYSRHLQDATKRKTADSIQENLKTNDSVTQVYIQAVWPQFFLIKTYYRGFIWQRGLNISHGTRGIVWNYRREHNKLTFNGNSDIVDGNRNEQTNLLIIGNIYFHKCVFIVSKTSPNTTLNNQHCVVGDWAAKQQ